MSKNIILNIFNYVNKDKLKNLQRLSLDEKIKLTKKIIKYAKNKVNKELIVSFSGGKDSTVLLDIVRNVYQNIPAIFSNTTNEHKYVLDFVKNTDNVIVVYPKKSFKQVIKEYGYPFVSKEFSEFCWFLFKWVHIDKTNIIYKTPATMSFIFSKTKNKKHFKFSKWIWLLDEKMFDYLIESIKKYYNDVEYINELKKVYEKQKYLRKHYNIENKKISFASYCCNILKKQPMNKKEIKNKYLILIGTMTEESKLRRTSILRNGFLNIKESKLMPLFFWKEKDILEYIKKTNLKISKAYETEQRTGCVVCGFGLRQDVDKFERAKQVTPKRTESILKTKNIYSDLTFGEVYNIIIDYIKNNKGGKYE